MIEFNGYITGVTEKRYWEKAKKKAQKIILLAGIVIFPIICVISYGMQSWMPIAILVLSIPAALLSTVLPKSSKEKRSFNPKCIYTEEEYIVCITDQDEESRRIDAVKCVYEYEEFYELEFNAGNSSDKFLCQKSLLTHGTILEFETLFPDKITKKTGDGFA